MCLDTVSKRKPKLTGFGWKIFYKQDERLYGEYRNAGKIRPMEKWLKEIDYRGNFNMPFPYPKELCLFCSKGGSYLYGFHIFKKKKDAEKWAACIWDRNIILKVEYKKAHTQGRQKMRRSFVDCIVAEEIKILPEKINKLKE